MIANNLKNLLRQIVYAQDSGQPVAQALQEAFFELTLIDRLMVAADTERARMVHEGLDVRKRPLDGSAFMLGFECDHLYDIYGPDPNRCTKCGKLEQLRP